MNAKRLYLSLGALAVIAVVVVILFVDEKPSTPPPVDPTAQLPPGHPKINGQSQPGDPNAPGKGNVRQDFIQELERLRTKIKAQKDSDTSDVLQLARMLNDSHMSTEALPLFERYLKYAPKNTDAMLDLAVAYYNMQNFDKAMSVTQNTLQIDPKNSTAMYNIGAIYATQNKTADAKKAWQSLVDRYPDSPGAARAKEALKEMSAPGGGMK